MTTSTDTDVNIPIASSSQLRVGATTITVGYPESDGTLSAIGVLSGRPGIVDLKGCSPASADNVMTTALVSGG